MLTDAQWTMLEPLIEACQLQAKITPIPSAPDGERDPVAA